MDKEQIKKTILQKQNEIYQGDRRREENNGKIGIIDLSIMDDEALTKTIFHFSLKKDKNYIEMEGLKSRIGRNSKGIDKIKAIYFSYGIQALLELWDVWLKWRANQLYYPYYQGQYKDTRERIEDGTASEEEKREYYYRCKLWDDEYISGQYRSDEQKTSFLFDFQIQEMLASNYYVLDLVEGEEFTFDEIDVKKAKAMSEGHDRYELKKFVEMCGNCSDMTSEKVDRWNMNTILGKEVIVEPERIKQIVLPGGKKDVLSILLYLYERYKSITPVDQQTKFDLLDQYVEYIRQKIRAGELPQFDRNERIDEIERIEYFHDNKSDEFFLEI